MNQRKRTTHPGYQLSLGNEAFVARWQPYVFGRDDVGSGHYIYGRDYEELINHIDLPNAYRGAERFDPRSSKFSRLIASSISPNNLQSLFTYSDIVERILLHDSDLRSKSSSSVDSYLAYLRDNHLDVFRYIPTIRDAISALRSALHGFDGIPRIISLDALEGTPFLLGLLNVVNSHNSTSWAIFGPDKYRGKFRLSDVSRPYIASSNMLDLFKDSAKTSIADSVDKYSFWSEGVLAGSDDRSLTLREANDFLRFARSDSPQEELVSQLVPPQVSAPLNVAVRDGVLTKIDIEAAIIPERDAINASCDHLLNLISDIRDAGHLSNWTPGAQRKLDRISNHLASLKGNEHGTIGSITQLGLDGEALREIFDRTKEELSDSVVREFSPFFLHMNLLLSQFPAWKQYLENAERLNWGRGASQSYTDALRDVFTVVREASPVAVDEGIRSYAAQVFGEDVTTSADIVGAASSARNFISEAVRFLIKSRDTLIRAGIKLASEQAAELAKLAIANLMSTMTAAVLVLARQNPTYFGWLEHAARVLGWSEPGTD